MTTTRRERIGSLMSKVQKPRIKRAPLEFSLSRKCCPRCKTLLHEAYYKGSMSAYLCTGCDYYLQLANIPAIIKE